MRGKAGFLAHRQRRDLHDQFGDRGKVGDGDGARAVPVVIMAMAVIIVGVGGLGLLVVPGVVTVLTGLVVVRVDAFGTVLVSRPGVVAIMGMGIFVVMDVGVLAVVVIVRGAVIQGIMPAVRVIVTVRHGVGLCRGMVMSVLTVSVACERRGQIAAPQQPAGHDEQHWDS